MSGIRHIDGFEKEILEKFENVIRDFGLTYLSQSNELGDECFLIGEKCELRFTYDRGDLNCSLINPVNREQFSANLVYEILFPSEKDYSFSWETPIDVQLDNYSRMIENRLKNILNGDFSWSKEYKRLFR